MLLLIHNFFKHNKYFNISMTEKELEELRFLNDYSQTIGLPVKDTDEIQLIEFILLEPYPFILTKNIYNFIEENYDEIKSLRLLTKQEEKMFDVFHKNYKEIMEFVDSISSTFKKKSIERRKEREQPSPHIIDWEEIDKKLKKTKSDS